MYSTVRGHFGICFLTLVMESILVWLLREREPKANYGDVLQGLRQVKATLPELKSKPFLLRVELRGPAYDAFQAVGFRPPLRLEPLPQPASS